MAGFIENEKFRNLLQAFPGKAIELLYNRYYRSLVAIAKKLTHDQEASEDIVQETFIHVWNNHENLGRYHERSFEYYLVKVVKYKAITQYKHNLHLKKKQDEFVNNHPSGSEPSIELKIIKTDLSSEVRQLIKSFPPRERECIFMKLDEELSTEQISERLQVSKKAVERSVTSANKRLKKYWLSRK